MCVLILLCLALSSTVRWQFRLQISAWRRQFLMLCGVAHFLHKQVEYARAFFQASMPHITAMDPLTAVVCVLGARWSTASIKKHLGRALAAEAHRLAI